VGLAGRVDERDHAHRLDGPDKAVPRTAGISRSALAGFCFPPDVIVLAVRWSLRFALSYRDVEELLAERGIQVDHVTIYRWAQRFTPLLTEAARPCRHGVGDRGRSTRPSSTPIPASSATTATASRGCDRCEGSNETTAPGL